jgi:O-acetyl-ADP-ribose deacetylase (regulator of RNase III)
MPRVRIGNATLEVVRGDITDQDTEAIVNAANNHLWMGAGVAGAIKRAGGPQIEQEAVAQGPIPVGEAVVTTGGRLKARYLIHAAGMGQDLRTDAGKLEQATKNSLKRAEEKGVRSVAFPAIGTGVGGFPIEECARVMIGAAADHLATTSCIERVVFVLFDEAGYEVFREQVKKLSSP